MAETKLRDLFPMIRTREEIRKEIEKNEKLQEIFASWDEKQKEEFLASCSGMKGVKILYDSFFKIIMGPERAPGRLDELLSLILGRNVRVLRTLPNEGGRVTPKTLVVMDLIVQLEDGSITTVEVQRYGYAFPGQRAACYSADMLLRQYKKKREEASEAKKHMNYRSIRPVYTIVLYESSPGIFHRFPEEYVHHFHQTSDTGLEMELLENYAFLALDNFRTIVQNKGIHNRLEAWLVFLSVDDPEWIERLIREYPEFRAMYGEVYELCRNLEEVMGMYSRELQELDEGTIQYMMDEMQEQIKEKEDRLKEKDEELKNARLQIQEKEEEARLQIKEKEEEARLQIKEKEEEARLQIKEIQEKEEKARLQIKEIKEKEEKARIRMEEKEEELKNARMQIEEMKRRIQMLENAGK